VGTFFIAGGFKNIRDSRQSFWSKKMETEFYGSIMIPGDRLADLEKAVEKLARRIEKGKTAADYPPTIEAVRDHFIPLANGEGVDLYHWVTIRYQTPVQEGWSLVAVYDWAIAPDGERTCYTSPVPRMMVLPEHREAEPGQCDHCNINRGRKKAMLITKNFIDYMVVGTSCIKDFLGHQSASSFVDLFSFHKMVTEANGARFQGSPTAYLNAADIVTIASMYVRQHGYVKAGSWNDTPTGSLVHTHLFPGIMRGTMDSPTAEDEQFATDAIEHIRGQSFASDYIENVVKALDAGWVTEKRIGILASVAGVYKAHTERLVADNTATLNEHRGEVNARLKGVQATVQRVRYSEGMYGTTSIVTLRDDEGRTLVWFASKFIEPEAGEQWTLDGTVKKHDEFNGTKQTVLTRVKYSEQEA
jgi:hypothetical protein